MAIYFLNILTGLYPVGHRKESQRNNKRKKLKK